MEVAELTRQFNSMAARLQDSMDIIRRDRDRSSDFLADVSHELRTPIAALRTFNDLLREGAVEDVTREEFLESSAQQIDRLDWLAQNLLELSKLDSGLLQLDLRPDDLRARVESAVEQAEAAARKRGVALSVVAPRPPAPHPPRPAADRAGREQPRRQRAQVHAARRHRDGDARGRRATGARIVVADTGVGIDASELPHIFDRFYRGSRSSEARASGSGLGLAIVKSIVDMHGGRIAVESRLGVGTTFTVTLPKDPRTVPAAVAERAPVRTEVADEEDSSPSAAQR